MIAPSGHGDGQQEARVTDTTITYGEIVDQSLGAASKEGVADILYEWWGSGRDASLVAIVRAAAACGLQGEVIQRMDDGQWKVSLFSQAHYNRRQNDFWCEFGSTPEEAYARALIKALAATDPEMKNM